MFEKLFLSL